MKVDEQSLNESEVENQTNGDHIEEDVDDDVSSTISNLSNISSGSEIKHEDRAPG